MKKTIALCEGAMHEVESANNRKLAFTLAEVLITLGVIGIVAAMTLPSLINKAEKIILKNQFKKTYSILLQAQDKVIADLGYIPACFYWDKNPYGSAKCVEYSSDGKSCKKYELGDGSALPSDYNGDFSECDVFTQQFLKNLNVIQHCKGKAFEKGCVPEYKGNDTLLKDKNPEMSDYDLNKAVVGCSNVTKNNLMNKSEAYVLADGSILMSSGTSMSLHTFIIDINGNKSPNKWGYDLFKIYSYSVSSHKKPKFKGAGGNCSPVEKGGVTFNQMVQDMHK